MTHEHRPHKCAENNPTERIVGDTIRCYAMLRLPPRAATAPASTNRRHTCTACANLALEGGRRDGCRASPIPQWSRHHHIQASYRAVDPYQKSAQAVSSCPRAAWPPTRLSSHVGRTQNSLLRQRQTALNRYIRRKFRATFRPAIGKPCSLRGEHPAITRRSNVHVRPTHRRAAFDLTQVPSEMGRAALIASAARVENLTRHARKPAVGRDTNSPPAKLPWWLEDTVGCCPSHSADPPQCGR
jgi:hypothetical protein